MNKKILLINDLAGYGKVALSAMIPVLSHMKYETYNLPTAIVSNTFDYGKFDILDTTEYMKNTLNVWEQLGFTFDAISKLKAYKKLLWKRGLNKKAAFKTK